MTNIDRSQLDYLTDYSNDELEVLCPNCFDRYAPSNFAHGDTLDSPALCSRCDCEYAHAVCITEYLIPRVRHFGDCDSPSLCECANDRSTVFICQSCASDLADGYSESLSSSSGACDACGGSSPELSDFVFTSLIPAR